MNKLETKIGEITKLENPIIAASGTVGYGEELSKLVDLKSFGAIATKGTTLKPRTGNESPRIAETPSGMLNSVGLENPGIDCFIKQKLPWLLQQNSKIFVNIAGSTVDEYVELVQKLNSTKIDAIELNISCPNVKQGGANFGSNKKTAFEVVSQAKKHTTKPLIVKLTPNVDSISEIAKTVECAGADAISLINTLLAMKIDIKTRRPVLKNNLGGLSGPAIFPIAVRMVWQIYNSIKIPVIGSGGISSANDVVEIMMAGAKAVEIGTVLFKNPSTACDSIVRELNDWLNQNHIEKLDSIVGTVRPW